MAKIIVLGAAWLSAQMVMDMQMDYTLYPETHYKSLHPIRWYVYPNKSRFPLAFPKFYCRNFLKSCLEHIKSTGMAIVGSVVLDIA